jgi:uncharacterized protein (DUF1015 family)
MWYASSVPRFEPFKGLRYDPSIVLDDVVAPPYDVVGPDERAKLAARHRANSIHVELPEDDPSSGLDKYAAAARLLSSWIEEGLVLRDEVPSMYSYRMTEPDGRTTTGVVGALACEPRDGDILPHEQTIPKDMSDRLNLLRACHANLSPIWGLSLTEGLAKTYDPVGPPESEATDDSGVLHQLWVIDDAASIDDVSKAVGRSPLVIADGHHRYETAIAYQAERREATGVGGDYDLVMALVVELAEDQLSVGAIHRVLSQLPADADLPELMGRWFECERVGEPADELAGELIGAGRLTLVTRKGIWSLDPRAEAYTAAGSDLDSSILALALDEVGGIVTTYSHDPEEAVRTVTTGKADAAVLIRPVTVAQISDWAHARRRMPPKSTYFHPKPRTGMVFRPVEG